MLSTSQTAVALGMRSVFAIDKILSFARVPFAGGGQTTEFLGNRGVYSDLRRQGQNSSPKPGRVVADSGQAEPKVVGFENRSGAYIWYVSTGSGENRRLQAGLT